MQAATRLHCGPFIGRFATSILGIHSNVLCTHNLFTESVNGSCCILWHFCFRGAPGLSWQLAERLCRGPHGPLRGRRRAGRGISPAVPTSGASEPMRGEPLPRGHEPNPRCVRPSTRGAGCPPKFPGLRRKPALADPRPNAFAPNRWKLHADEPPCRRTAPTSRSPLVTQPPLMAHRTPVTCNQSLRLGVTSARRGEPAATRESPLRSRCHCRGT